MVLESLGGCCEAMIDGLESPGGCCEAHISTMKYLWFWKLEEAAANPSLMVSNLQDNAVKPFTHFYKEIQQGRGPKILHRVGLSMSLSVSISIYLHLYLYLYL